jgi:molybdopterin-binding protein
MELSARNQIPGTVTSVKLGTVMAEIEVRMEAGEVVAAITAGSATALDLKEGDRVSVVVKATEVMIAK